MCIRLVKVHVDVLSFQITLDLTYQINLSHCINVCVATVPTSNVLHERNGFQRPYLLKTDQIRVEKVGAIVKKLFLINVKVY